MWDTTTDASLRFARLVAGVWEIATVDAEALSAEPCLAFDGATPYISYYKDLNARDLSLAHEEPPGWVIEIIDYEPPPPKPLFSWRGKMSSMVIDLSGQKHISYLAITGVPAPIYSELKLARKTDTSISLEVVGSEQTPSGFGGPTSIALDPVGCVRIAYLFGQYAAELGSLTVASEANPGGHWVLTAFPEGDSVRSPSLKITGRGKSGMSYCSDEPLGSYWLKYMENTEGQWGDPEFLAESVRKCSLSFTQDGRPSVAYQYNPAPRVNHLQYVERW